jgi:hypothetical protein
MSLKPLALEDRPRFRALERAFPPATSDVNFTNMFIWNDYYHFSWAMAFGCLCLVARPEGQEPFAMPPLGGGDAVKAAEFLFGELGMPAMSRVPEAMAALLARERPSWRAEPDPDNDDYVYLTEKLINLSGRRMHQKKNHLNYFRQNYRAEYVEVTGGLVPELTQVEDLWLTAKTEKVGPQSHLVMERKAVHLLLANLGALELSGLAIRVDGKIQAFAIGEELSPDTGLVHVEKGNPEFRGIYVALCSEFCRRSFASLAYVNREQDLGLPGLRFSKESLKPHRMAKKFVIRPE